MPKPYTSDCAPQAVIFLYLLDNNTSFVVLASSFVGLLIELWKVAPQTQTMAPEPSTLHPCHEVAHQDVAYHIQRLLYPAHVPLA